MFARCLLLLLTVLTLASPAQAIVNEVIARDDYVGNGSTTSFPYTWRITANTTIEVLVNGVTQNLDTAYTVTGINDPGGGAVVFFAPPASGAKVTLLRLQPKQQVSVYQPNEAFPARRLELDLDKNTMVDQQQEEELRRAPKFFKQSLFHDINITDPVSAQCLAWETATTPTKIVNVACGTGGGGGGGSNANSLNAQSWTTFPDQLFANDTNFTISSAGGVHTLGMTGCLPVARGGIGFCSGTEHTMPFFNTASSLTLTNAGTDGTVLAGDTSLGPRFTNVPLISTLLTQGGPAIVMGPWGTSAGQTGDIRFQELVANGFNYVGFKAPDAIAADVIWTLPSADGTAGQVLKTNGLGVLSWVSAAGTGTTTGTGVANQIAVWDNTNNLAGFMDFTWDESLGNFSAGQGPNTFGLTTQESTALGTSNTIGDGSSENTAIGAFNNVSTVSGSNNNALGSFLTIDGGASTGVGTSSTVSGGVSFSFGNNNNVSGATSTAVGSFVTISDGSSQGLGNSVSILGGGDNVGVGQFISMTGSSGAAFGQGLTVTHNSATVIGNGVSSVADTSVSIGMSTSPEVTITANLVEIGQIGSPSVVLQFDGSTSGSTSLKAGATPTPTVFTLPTADGAAGTCLSTNGSGVWGWANCSSGGTGLTSLGGQTGATQTFSSVSDTNVTLATGSAANVHTFTMGWTGLLSNARGGTGQNTSAWSALPLITAGIWSQYAGSTCSAGQVATSISASGALTCATAGSGTMTNAAPLTFGVPVVGAGANAAQTMSGGLTNAVYYSGGSGAMTQSTQLAYFQSQGALVLGVGSLPPSSPWGTPKLFAADLAEIGSVVGATGPILRLESTNGTFGTPTASVNNNVLGTIGFYGHDGTTGVQGARMYSFASAPPVTGFIPTNIAFETTDTAGVKHTPLTLRGTGNVVFGKKIIGYNGIGATDGALLIGNGSDGRFDANTLIAGPGISITNGPGTIQITNAAVALGCAGGGRVTVSDTNTEAVVTFATPLANANYAMSSSVIPGAGAVNGIPILVKDVTVNGFTVVLSAAPGTGFSTSVAWIATPSTCTF